MTVGVYVTEQVPLARVHVVELKVPVPVLANVTVPPGTIAVPGDVSVTVAVHVVTLLTTMEAGAQLIVVEVVRKVTVTVVAPFAGAL